MKPVKYIVTSENITVIWEGKPYTVQASQPNFAGLKNALLKGNWEEIPKYLSIVSSIASISSGNVRVQDGKVFYKNTELHGVVVDKLLQFLKEGLSDAKPLLRFIEKLHANVSANSIEQLYNFLSYKSLPLTEDGDVIGYKGVAEDYFSVKGNTKTVVIQGLADKEGRLRNRVGDVIEVQRSSVDDNCHNHCSSGLHVGSYDYAKEWARGTTRGKLMMVSFDPSDAVSVPTDCSFQKLRVCKYKVLSEIPLEHDPLNHAVYTTVDDKLVASTQVSTTPSKIDGYDNNLVFAIKNYVENRPTAPTLKQIQSRLKGSYLTCQEIEEICLDLGFAVEKNNQGAHSNALVIV